MADLRKSPQTFRTERLEAFDSSWAAKRLKNGLSVIHIPTPNEDHFFLGMMIRAGSRCESTELSGISHFLEHMMFRGCNRYPQFTRLAEAFEWLGGDWNAATGQEHTEYWYSGIRHTADEVMELFAEFLEHPVLADIDVERKVILRELEGEFNDHGHSTDLDFHIAGLFWPGTTMALPILGTEKSLEAITVGAMKEYRDRFYVPQNMALCAVGGGPSEDVMTLLDRHFASHRAAFSGVVPPPFPRMCNFEGPAVKWVEHSDNEYEIQLSFLCDGEWSDDVAVYEVITRILSDGFCSRLSSRLREELGLVYGVDCDTSLHLEQGTVDITASVKPDQLDRFFRELTAILRALVENGPTDEELSRTIIRSVVDLELSPSDPEDVGSRLCWSSICQKKTSLLEDRNKLTAITSERVKEVSKTIFRARRAALVALGPASNKLEFRLREQLEKGLPM